MRTAAVKTFSLGMIAGSFLTAGTVFLASPAKADVDDTSIAYALQYSEAVCSTLDKYPSFGGIVGIAQAITEDGLTMRQAGTVIGLSVAETCPWHTGLMNRFIAATSSAAV